VFGGEEAAGTVRSLNFCTVIAKNYFAFARIRTRSLAMHHPAGRLWTLIVDDYEGYIDRAEEPFEVVNLGDIGCRPFDQMVVRYTVFELSTGGSTVLS
jgi:hypothetical protein